jgi:hypothetical protein
MQSIEGDQTCLLPSLSAGYEAVRFNAMKHGILSQLTVLAHENAGDFADLLNALIEEHKPSGITERHLVEELAAIIWRKRRVLLAEGAKINSGLKCAVNNPALIMPASAPLQVDLNCDDADLPDLLATTPDEVARRQRDAALDLVAIDKAASILRKGGARAYEKARLALLGDSRDWWGAFVEEGTYPASVEGLQAFIDEHLRPLCQSKAVEARFIPAIKAQVVGESLQAHRLEKLNRYETHLDRKFERTLAMILKLKELRKSSQS